VALLHRSHGATVDLESKGAGVNRGVVKAWGFILYLVGAVCYCYRVRVPCGHPRILPARTAYLFWGPEDPHYCLAHDLQHVCTSPTWLDYCFNQLSAQTLFTIVIRRDSAYCKAASGVMYIPMKQGSRRIATVADSHKHTHAGGRFLGLPPDFLAPPGNCNLNSHMMAET
jgi:hypothetical protein